MLNLLLAFGLGTVHASDLLYKSGFENAALLSGTAINLNSSGLSVKLTVNANTEVLNIEKSGLFIFSTYITVGDSWFVEILKLPNTPQQQNCTASNTSGPMPSSGANTLQIHCDNVPWNWDQMNWEEGGWN